MNKKKKKTRSISILTLVILGCLTAYYSSLNSETAPVEKSSNSPTPKYSQIKNISKDIEKKSITTTSKTQSGIPIGSNISFFEIQKSLKEEFKEIEFELSENYDCPKSYNTETESFPFEVNSTHCEKLKKENDIVISTLNNFNQQEIMQHLVASFNKVDKSNITHYSLSFSDQSLNTVMLGMMGYQNSCFEIYFNENSAIKLVIDEGYDLAIKDIKKMRKTGVKINTFYKEIHIKAKNKILSFLSKLCESYDDRRACNIKTKVSNLYCGE